MAILDEIQEGIARLAEGAGSSVVGIGQRWGAGSGIVLGEGRVLTNAHNVRGDQVAVTFADGRTAEGTVVGRDIDADLAVVEADTGGAPALPWADGAPASIGTPVFALANPGGRGLRVTFGFVSGIDRAFRGPRGRRITGSVEHTAPLLPGSSGGPVVNAAGATARDQHQPPRRGLLPGHARRRGTARQDRRARSRRIHDAAATRHRHRPRTRGPADAPGRRPPGPRGPAHPRGNRAEPGGTRAWRRGT